MTTNVLIVDDNQETLLSLKDGLEFYDETLSVFIAGDGLVAMDKLRENPISIVVTDLKMPMINGFTLLAHIMEHYPDISVIVMTGYSTVNMEKQAAEGGAQGYIEKPFKIEGLSQKITKIMRSESEGGTLHGVSAGMFLQLMEMEGKTCTIRLVDKQSRDQGVLFFREGKLINARTGDLNGITAAYEIFSWEKVNLSIQNLCLQKEEKIEEDLQTLLLEAMRMKDEAGRREKPVIILKKEETDTFLKEDEEPVVFLRQDEDSETFWKKENGGPEIFLSTTLSKDTGLDKRPAEKASTKSNSISLLMRKLEKKMGKVYGLEDIYQDNSWDDLVKKLMSIGRFFQAGELNLAYVDKGETTDFILVPGHETTVISVSPKCPKERIMQILCD